MMEKLGEIRLKMFRLNPPMATAEISAALATLYLPQTSNDERKAIETNLELWKSDDTSIRVAIGMILHGLAHKEERFKDQSAIFCSTWELIWHVVFVNIHLVVSLFRIIS
jgi:hypothetical protein